MSWRIVMMEEPGVVSPQLRSFFFLTFFLRCFSNTSESLFTPDIRIHDAQHPRCKKKKLTFTFDLTRRAFFGLSEFFSNPL
jgi:hypothetical protein